MKYTLLTFFNRVFSKTLNFWLDRPFSPDPGKRVDLIKIKALNSSLLELQTVVAMLGDTPLLIEQPEFVDLQLNLKSVQSDIGQLQSGLQIGNEKTEALKKEITLIEGELEENRDMSRSHQVRVKKTKLQLCDFKLRFGNIATIENSKF